jgi:hypothetical protein
MTKALPHEVLKEMRKEQKPRIFKWVEPVMPFSHIVCYPGKPGSAFYMYKPEYHAEGKTSYPFEPEDLIPGSFLFSEDRTEPYERYLDIMLDGVAAGWLYEVTEEDDDTHNT